MDAVRFTLDQHRQQVDCDAGRIQLDSIGKVRFRLTKPLDGRLRSVTVRRDSAGRWFATITADGVPAPVAAPAVRQALGIDLGLASTAVFFDGHVADARKPLARKQARLRRFQRHYVRQRDAALRRQGLDPVKRTPKGTRIEPSSGRRRRTQVRIVRLHAGIADADAITRTIEQELAQRDETRKGLSIDRPLEGSLWCGLGAFSRMAPE